MVSLKIGVSSRGCFSNLTPRVHQCSIQMCDMQCDTLHAYALASEAGAALPAEAAEAAREPGSISIARLEPSVCNRYSTLDADYMDLPVKAVWHETRLQGPSPPGKPLSPGMRPQVALS